MKRSEFKEKLGYPCVKKNVYIELVAGDDKVIIVSDDKKIYLIRPGVRVLNFTKKIEKKVEIANEVREVELCSDETFYGMFFANYSYRFLED